MKLYATVSSDRASKGQGGNKDIRIDLFAGSAKNSVKIAEVILENDGDEQYSLYATTLTLGEDNQCIDAFIDLNGNGEQEKGDRVCTKCKGKSFDIQGICQSCGHR